MSNINQLHKHHNNILVKIDKLICTENHIIVLHYLFMHATLYQLFLLSKTTPFIQFTKPLKEWRKLDHLILIFLFKFYNTSISNFHKKKGQLSWIHLFSFCNWNIAKQQNLINNEKQSVKKVNSINKKHIFIIFPNLIIFTKSEFSLPNKPLLSLQILFQVTKIIFLFFAAFQ